ncbi:MAG: carbon storage regulator CsrA [Thermodesulforhabdaceae bacterium]
MLILSRKEGEAIRIGDDIEIIVTEITSNRVKIGIRSPRNIPVYREELYQRIKEENRQAALMTNSDLIESLPFIIKSELKGQPKEGEGK